MKLQGAIFDMDGTLVDSLHAWDFLSPRLGEKYLGDPTFHPTPEDDKYFRTALLWQVAVCFEEKYHFPATAQEIYGFMNELIVEFYQTQVKCKPGVTKFLDFLQENNIPFCLATATAQPLVKIALAATGLAPYFSKVISCADVGKGKDQPDVFLAACQMLGTDPAETFVFEDSLTAICTAKAAGMPTVGIHDAHSLGWEEIAAKATLLVKEGQTMTDLIPTFCAP